VATPLDMVRSPSLPYAQVFDLPLAKFFMWVFPDWGRPYQVRARLLSVSIVLCCVALRCVGLRWLALACVALCYVALACVALRCVALRCVALRCVALRCVALCGWVWGCL
jgi:hypothetical protein